MTIAPWLHPINFVAAAQAGAASGLGIRRANQEATEAADRLQLAYEQLASNERRSNEATRERMAVAKASLALRGQQMDAVRAYHENQIDARNREIDNTAAYREGTLDSQAAHEAGLQDRFANREAATADRFNTRQENVDQAREDRAKAADALESRFQRRQEYLEKRYGSDPGRLSPSDFGLMNADISDLKSVQRQIATIDAAGGPSRGRLWLTAGTTKTYPELKAKEIELRKKIAGYSTPKNQAGQVSGPASAPATYQWDPKTRRIMPIGAEDENAAAALESDDEDLDQ